MADPTEQRFESLANQILPGRSTVLDQPTNAASRVGTDPSSRRSQLIESLPRLNRFQARQAQMELQAIRDEERAQDFETRLRTAAAKHAQTEADRQLTLNRRSLIDEHAANAMDTMLKAERLYRSGQISQDDYDNVISEIPRQFPYALQHGAAAGHLRFSAEQSDKTREYEQRQSQREASIVARKYGVPIQANPDTGEPSLEATLRSAMDTPRGRSEQLNFMNQELQRRYGIGIGLAPFFNPVQPHVGVDEKGNQVANATHIRLPYLDKKGQVGSVNLPMDIFNQVKQTFEPTYRELTGTNIAPQPEAAPAPATSGIPQVGDVRSGYVFKGGNPNDQANWEAQPQQ